MADDYPGVKKVWISPFLSVKLTTSGSVETRATTLVYTCLQKKGGAKGQEVAERTRSVNTARNPGVRGVHAQE